MSFEVDPALMMRPGQLVCACPGDQASSGDNRAALALGFGLAVLAQALVLTVLPEQSRLIAPDATRIGWPFALLLVGAAAASFPAALLIDSFGRRAAFALGGSLGAAGAALGVFAIDHFLFGLLCLAAFWLGLAQGFALFYRHVAAQGARGSVSVLAGGAGAALAAPAVLALAPEPGMTLAIAAMLHITALALAVRQPHARFVSGPEARAAGASWRAFTAATAAGALAWFLMAAGMLHGPLALSLCSAAPAFVGGATGWHLFAMYGPAALAARWPAAFAPAASLFFGLLLMFAGFGAVTAGRTVAAVAAGLLAIGAGWSLVNIATLRLLHGGAPPGRRMLALHDLIILTAAAAGAAMI